MASTTPKTPDLVATGESGDGRPFVHLHLHSEYSLLDGGNRVTALVNRVKDLGMPAVAVTDHGNLHAAMEFYLAARAAGVKPILGIEAYVAPGDRREKKPTGIADGGFHLVLLAETLDGWQNLIKLSSDAFLNGFYYKPRMDKSTLAEWSEGLIAINGHLGSSLAWHLDQYARSSSDERWEEVLEEARWHARTFGANADGEPRFYVELQRHVPEQERINPLLKRLATELDLPLVADNDAHFLRAEDHDVHDTLCCISMGKLKDEAQRIRYPTGLYVRSPEEMWSVFDEDEAEREALRNSARIAARCDVELPVSGNHAPIVRVISPGEAPAYDPATDGDLTEWFKAYCARFELRPYDAASEGDEEAETAAAELKDECDRALRDLSEAGLIWRYGPDGATPEIRERLERELTVLSDKMISAYFLIVWDFVNWARQRGIPANARGSGVGTMVGYVLGLSNACPVAYGLLFERFTDPDRTEYPDIDIDICQDGRADVIDHVRQKYGYVAQIITFGRLKAKAAVKDVARVMGLLPAEGQRLSNLIPNELKITIDDALQKVPELRAEYEGNPVVAKVIDSARGLEDHARHAGVHAAGVIVATQPLENIVPLCKASGNDDVVTQWDGPTCERIGLLKMDFLGLRTLSTIEQAKRLVRESMADEAIWTAVGRTPGDGPHPLDLDRLRYDDQQVLDLFRRADTAGVFQFESGGMRKLLIDMQPDRLEDLIAANALFRPGPMDLIPDYNDRKHGRQAVPTVHPIVDEYTRESYGIMVYQEQVMQVLHGLGGIPLRAAYSIIKAISKKKQDVINSARADFVAGAVGRGVKNAQAEELFDLILKFAGYGFNKSHSTGYAIIAYQTAYLKTYFPGHFMAAVLSFESQASKIEDWSTYLDECRRVQYPDHAAARPHVGVDVRPPDIGLSETRFSLVYAEDEPRDALHGHIRFGLGAIKGAGGAAVRSIVEERRRGGPFRSLFDFCERVDLRSVNRATLESLIKAGAFDSLHGVDARSALIATLDDAVSAGQSLARDRAAGQMSFFGSFDETQPEVTQPEPTLARAEPWDRMTALSMEKDALGFHVSGHPLDVHDATIRAFCSATTSQLESTAAGTMVLVAGMLSRVQLTTARNGRSAGQRMAQLTIADRVGTIDGVIFPESFARSGHLLQPDAIVVICGQVDRSRGPTNLIVEQVFPIDSAGQHLCTSLDLSFVQAADDGEPLEPLMQMVSGVLRQATGIGGESRGRAVPVTVTLPVDARLVSLAPSRVRVVPEPDLVGRLRQMLGGDSVQVRGGFIPEPARRRRRRPAPEGDRVAV